LSEERRGKRKRKEVEVEFFSPPFFQLKVKPIVHHCSLFLSVPYLPRPLFIADEKSCGSGPLGRSFSPERPSRSKRGESIVSTRSFPMPFSKSVVI
jgi:hypothetical protein